MRFTSVLLVLTIACGVAAATEKADLNKAAATLNENEILLPADYHSWVALAPATPGMPRLGRQHVVSRIYVEPTAYEGFVREGVWPDHSVIVLELRDKPGLPKNGCDGVIGLEVAAKDDGHLANPWNYYGIIFDQHKRSAETTKNVCTDCGPSTTDMRLAMFFPALRAVINAKPQAMQPAAF